MVKKAIKVSRKYHAQEVFTLRPNGNTVRYPEKGDFSEPLDAFIVLNKTGRVELGTGYTVWVLWDKEKIDNTDNAVPIDPGESFFFGFTVERNVLCYSSSDTTSTNGVVFIGLKEAVSETELEDKIIRREAEAGSSRVYREEGVPAYLRGGGAE